MKNLISWFIAIWLVFFWGFRIAVTISEQYGNSFGGFIVFDKTLEIILLFVSLLCFILIFKRKLSGIIIYLVGYGFYFGKYIFLTGIPALMSEQFDMAVVQNMAVAVIGILLGFFELFDMLIERAKKKNYSDNKTDWFFKNKKYERQYDERADKNQYKIL